MPAVKRWCISRGAHGAMPDKGIDPIVQGSRFVNDVQTVISRQKNGPPR